MSAPPARAVAAARPIVGCGAGTGISAKFAEAGGADLIIIYNSGRYRMAGRGSLAGLLAYGDANAIVVDMASRGAARVVKMSRCWPASTAPTRSGSCPCSCASFKEIGFSGVQNFPTVGLIDGNFRANLEATGMGYDKEVDAIAIAHEIDLFCSPYVFDVDQAKAMVRAGADHARRARRPDHGRLRSARPLR